MTPKGSGTGLLETRGDYMKIKLLKDVEMEGVIHKKGELLDFSDLDKIDKDGCLYCCFGHGAYIKLKKNEFSLVERQDKYRLWKDVSSVAYDHKDKNGFSLSKWDIGNGPTLVSYEIFMETVNLLKKIRKEITNTHIDGFAEDIDKLFKKFKEEELI